MSASPASRRLLERFPLLPWILVGGLLALALWQRLTLAFNGPYLDESDYLYVSRMLNAGVHWNTYTYVFSSHLPIELLGIAERIGGLYGARGLAAVLGLASLGLCFAAVRALLGTRVAGWSTLVLMLAAPHVFISKFATYDIPAFFFAALAAWLLAEALRRRRRAWAFASAASLAFAAAVLSKYLVILLAPVLAVLVAVRRPRLLAWALLPCAAVLLEYAHRHWPDLRSLYQNQVLHAHAGNSTRAQLLWLATSYVGPVLLLAGAAVAGLVARSGARWRVLRVPLALATLAAPVVAMHLRSADMVSMYKHMVYPVAALAPLAGLFLHRLSRRRALLPFALVAAMGALGHYQTRQMERAFPDFRALLAAIAPDLKPETSIMSEEAYLFRYAFAGSSRGEHFYEMTWFDNDKDGQHTPQDVIDAVWDGKADYVMTYGQITPKLAHKLREGVLPHSYHKVYVQPYQLSGVMSRITAGTIELWKRNGPYQGKHPL